MAEEAQAIGPYIRCEAQVSHQALQQVLGVALKCSEGETEQASLTLLAALGMLYLAERRMEVVERTTTDEQWAEAQAGTLREFIGVARETSALQALLSALVADARVVARPTEPAE
jgi:hypothetical protein